MLPNEPTGSRAQRSSGRTNSSRIPSRGGIHKHNNTKPRMDRDGDLIMGAASATRGAGGSGRGGRNSRRGSSDLRGSKHHNTRIDPQVVQQVIAQGLGSRGPNRGPGRAIRSGRKPAPIHDTKENLDEISVLGLEKSLAASNPGGGVSELIAWLEQKASKSASEGEKVMITKSRLDGAALIISVRPQDTPKITRLNDFTFAKAKLSIELISKAKSLESLPTESTAGSETGNTINTLKDFLYRRYNAEAKFLDLSGLSKDSELVNVGMFKTTSRESKFFPALMKVCGDQFPDAKSKEEAIVSVSLADNSLTSISSVTALAQTFPNLRNLDLSNNQIKNLAALGGWRWKFRKLNHLIISGNPIEAEGQSYQQDMLKWYPSLTNINNKQVRSQEEVEAALKGKLPIPILPASFRDEASISENFVKVFFPAYDSDRSSLVNNFYDAKSTFSLSVNSKAPRSLGSVGQQLPGWDSYLKRSRNLTMISQLPAKMNRLYKGTDNIREALTTLPPTLHPDLMAEPQKWCIECHTIPGLQDMTGQSPTGVGGMIVIIHGEFTEVDGYTRQGTVKRSFDRTFVLGPGGPTGIRVSSDVLVLRQYGGYDAWQPDEGTMGGSLPSQASNQIHIETPPGFAMEGLGRSDEQVMKEKLILEMSQRTGLTLEGSHECLELMGWSPEGAMNAFLASKDSLPKQAFIATR